MQTTYPSPAGPGLVPGPAGLRPGDRALLGVLGAGIAGYFVVRGWLNAVVVLVALYCLVQLVRGRAGDPAPADRQLRWLVAALVAPFVAVSAVQLSHLELVPRYFDAPLRLMLCAAILLYLVRRRLDFLAVAQYAFPAAVLVCAAMIFLVPQAAEYFWGGRFATYFIDPLSLAQHVTIAGFICLFSVDATGRDGAATRTLKYAAFVAALAVSVGTQSRTGWTMAPILAAIWLMGLKGRGSVTGAVAAAALVTAGCTTVYWTSSLVHSRIDMAVQDVVQYFQGVDRDTSLGIRISLARANWIIFCENPLRGWGYSSLPDLAAHPQIATFFTPLFESYFVRSGGHNELLQSMMRMGIVGGVSRLLLLLVPLWIFVTATRSGSHRRRTNGYLGLAASIGYLTASLSSEVFNLIYAASFYGLLVAVFAAGALMAEPARPAEPAARP